MKTIAEIDEIRKNTLKEIDMRIDTEATRIVVGMGTCGIASGARDVLHAFVKEIQERGLEHVNVSTTGCLGDCSQEPVVEIVGKDGDRVRYVKMNSEKAAKVMEEHIVGGKVCTEYTLNENE